MNGDAGPVPLSIRAASRADWPAIWRIFQPILAEGETYALDAGMPAPEAEAYWFARGNEVHVACAGDAIVGAYYLRANQRGGGAHVANAGFIVDRASGVRGVGRAMGVHALVHARTRGFRAMQFNFVVSSNTRAVGLWHSLGFETIGRIPAGFLRPGGEAVDALVLYRPLA